MYAKYAVALATEISKSYALKFPTSLGRVSFLGYFLRSISSNRDFQFVRGATRRKRVRRVPPVPPIFQIIFRPSAGEIGAVSASSWLLRTDEPSLGHGISGCVLI